MTREQNLRIQAFLGHHKKYPKQKMEPPTIHEKNKESWIEFGSDIMAIINLPTS